MNEAVIAALGAPVATGGARMLFGTVTTVTPLGVHLDGDTLALSVSPSCMSTTALDSGDRVLCIMQDGILVVLGSIGKPSVPAGTMSPYAGQSVPDGWVMCDGRLLDRTEYARLFAAIGTVYGGGGDGSTVFAVPYMCGRVPVGWTQGDADFGTFGASGGSKDAALIAHDHALPAQVVLAGQTSSGWNTGFGTAGAAYSKVGTVADSAPARPMSVAGSTDTGNQNLQPYVVMHYIIRT